MIQIERVSKFYGDKQVLEDVSLSIEKGTITSFIGPNGAGKSTLISMISRLIAQDDGDILIEGKDVRRQDSNKLAQKISILNQSNHIHLKLTVRELVSFGRFPYSKGKLTKEDWAKVEDRKSTRLNSSHVAISYAVFCLKKKKQYIKYYK